MQVVNPATGEVIEEVAEASPASVTAAYAAARDAGRRWSTRPLNERISILERFAHLVAERVEPLASLLTEETGKPIAQARAELEALEPRLAFFSDRVSEVAAEESVFDDGRVREVIVHEPLGVVASISAWNYPWFVSTNVVVPALLTGNAVLFKPSELACRTGRALGDLLTEAGVPEGVFAVLPGEGPTGAAVAAQPVDGVFFTGSYATGRRLAESLADRMITVQLELGGTDAAYVTEDVDVDAAARGVAEGVFYNNGQSCCAVERTYVHERVHDAFVERFLAVVDGLVLGDPTDERTDLGPLARGAAPAELARQVADAVAAGATLRTGGEPIERPGNWFPPTVLTDVRDDMALMREESFGPVIGIASVSGDEEALARAGDTEYGLTASVWCRDERRARHLLGRLDVGSAYWNCCDRVSPRLPWTGRRRSGTGVSLSTQGIRSFLRPKALHLRQP